MPKSCKACPYSIDMLFDDRYCSITQEECPMDRPDWCPLKEQKQEAL